MSIISWIKNKFKRKTLSNSFDVRNFTMSDGLKWPKPPPRLNITKDSKLLEDITSLTQQLYGISETSIRNVYHILRPITPGNMYVYSKCGTLCTSNILEDIPSNRRLCKLCKKIIDKQLTHKQKVQANFSKIIEEANKAYKE